MVFKANTENPDLNSRVVTNCAKNRGWPLEQRVRELKSEF